MVPESIFAESVVPVTPAVTSEVKPGAEPDKFSRAERRINELTSQKYALARALDAAQNQSQELEGRLAALEAAQSQAKPAAGSVFNRDWKDLSEAELLGLVQGDGSTPVDGTTIVRVTREIARREADARVAESQKAMTAQAQQTQRVNEAWSRVISEFGPEAAKADSPIRQRAEAIAEQVLKVEGKDAFTRSPALLYLVFATASGQIGASKAADASKELERLRSLEKTYGAGGVPTGGAPEANVSIRDLLAKGDVRGAVENLDLVRALRGLPPKSDAGTQ